MKTTLDRRRSRPRRAKAGGMKLTLLGLLLTVLTLALLPMRSLSWQAALQPTAGKGEGQYVVGHGLTRGQWPSPLVHQFNIERSDKTRFHGLKASDLRVELDGQRIDLETKDLWETEDRRVKVLLLIDGSGSMSPKKQPKPGATPEPDKLPAAKKALTTFVDQLGEHDIAAIYAFDRGVWEVAAPTTDKDELKKRINGFRLRWRGEGDPHYTYLYAAILEALQKARSNGIRNLVVLSDGIDYTSENKASIDAGKSIEPYKTRNEEEIRASALKDPKVHILTIAVGDERGVGNARVDRESLANITDPTIARDKGAIYVGLPEVLQAAKDGEGKVSELLAGRLRGSFEEIRKLLKYDYELIIRPPAGLKQDDEEHHITIACDICGETQPLTLAYTWPPGGAFSLKRIEGQPKNQFYATTNVGAAVDRFGLAKIYLGLLSLLTMLGLAPVATRRLGEHGAARHVRSAIVEVKDGSPFIGRECPNERDGQGGENLIKARDVLVVCPNPECRTPHHMDCWHLTADHCWRRGCQLHLPIPQHLIKRYGFADSEGGAPA